MGDAASRLLKVLDERAEKRKNSAGEDLGRRQFADQPMAESGAEPERRVGCTLDGSAPTAARGLGGCSGLEEIGRAGFQPSTVRFILRCKGTARPTLDEPLLTDRAKRHAPEDG